MWWRMEGDALPMLIDERERKIRLTEKETNILKFLYRAPEGVVARDVLVIAM